MHRNSEVSWNDHIMTVIFTFFSITSFEHLADLVSSSHLALILLGHLADLLLSHLALICYILLNCHIYLRFICHI